MSCAIHFAGSQDTCLRAAVSSLQDYWITDEGEQHRAQAALACRRLGVELPL